MVAKGTFGKYTPSKPSMTVFWIVVTVLTVGSVWGGYTAGIQPNNTWRLFSWHPFLMTTGMVGLSGVGAMVKKLGGYTNTKLHALFAGSATLTSLGGIYAIYQNKENNGFGHLRSNHSWMGAFCMSMCVLLGAAGSIFLHPDFGVDKTNQTIRLAHKMGSRLTLIAAWFTAFYGLLELVPDNTVLLAAYGMPLLLMIPFVLM